MYSIQKFVLQKIKEKGLTSATFVQSMCYKNVSKGCRHLDEFINDNQCKPQFLIMMKKAINADAEFEQSMFETEKELRAERERRRDIERKNFIPFLFVQTERNLPSPIFACAILGADRMKKIELHVDFTKMSEAEQDEIRRERIAESMAKREGSIPTFGHIVCFTQKLDYDDVENEREVYDLNGNLVPDPEEQWRRVNIGRATLSVRGRDLTGLFKNLRGE